MKLMVSNIKYFKKLFNYDNLKNGENDEIKSERVVNL